MTGIPGSWLNYAGLGLVALIWSASFLAIKVAVATVPPYTITAGRMLLGASLLFLFLRWQRLTLPRDRESWLVFAFIGAFGNALPFTLINWGEIHIDSGLAAILMGIMPVATVVLANLLIHDEPFNRRRALGTAMGFAGVVVLVGRDAVDGIGAAVVAQLAVLGGAVSYAVTTVYARRRATLPGPVMASGSTIAGTLWILPLALWERPWTIDPGGGPLLALVWLGVFPTAVATILYFHLIRTLGATTFAQVNYLVPVLGTIWGVALLGERPGWAAIAALALVVSGVAVVSRAGRRPA